MNATGPATCQTPQRACTADDPQSSPLLEPERKVIKIDLTNRRSPAEVEQRVPVDELRQRKLAKLLSTLEAGRAKRQALPQGSPNKKRATKVKALTLKEDLLGSSLSLTKSMNTNILSNT